MHLVLIHLIRTFLAHRSARQRRQLHFSRALRLHNRFTSGRPPLPLMRVDLTNLSSQMSPLGGICPEEIDQDGGLLVTGLGEDEGEIQCRGFDQRSECSGE